MKKIMIYVKNLIFKKYLLFYFLEKENIYVDLMEQI